MILSVRYNNILWSYHPLSGSDMNIYRDMFAYLIITDLGDNYLAYL